MVLLRTAFHAVLIGLGIIIVGALRSHAGGRRLRKSTITLAAWRTGSSTSMGRRTTTPPTFSSYGRQ
jgi:hypothetical protein